MEARVAQPFVDRESELIALEQMARRLSDLEP